MSSKLSLKTTRPHTYMHASTHTIDKVSANYTLLTETNTQSVSYLAERKYIVSLIILLKSSFVSGKPRIVWRKDGRTNIGNVYSPEFLPTAPRHPGRKAELIGHLQQAVGSLYIVSSRFTSSTCRSTPSDNKYGTVQVPHCDHSLLF